MTIDEKQINGSPLVSPKLVPSGTGSRPAYGDGINGKNMLNTEKLFIAHMNWNEKRNNQNADLFRVSLRLEKVPASIGDFVWNDLNNNGIQDEVFSVE